MVFRNISPESKAHVAAVREEMKRLHGLSDLWLGNAILKLAREARELCPDRFGAPSPNDGDNKIVWQIVPLLAHRLGVRSLQINEGSDPYMVQANPAQFRRIVGVYLQCSNLLKLGKQILAERGGDRVTPTAFDILGNLVVNGNPIEMALSRLTPPVTRDKFHDPLAAFFAEIGGYRGHPDQLQWDPSFNEVVEKEKKPSVSEVEEDAIFPTPGP